MITHNNRKKEYALIALNCIALGALFGSCLVTPVAKFNNQPKTVHEAGFSTSSRSTRVGFCKTDPSSSLSATTTSKQTFTALDYQGNAPLIPANSLNVGDILTISEAINYSSSAIVSPSITLGLDLNGTSAFSAGTITNLIGLSSKGAVMRCNFVVTAVGPSGTLSPSGEVYFNTALGTSSVTMAVPTSQVPIDTTIDNAIMPTITYGSTLTGNTSILNQYWYFISSAR